MSPEPRKPRPPSVRFRVGQVVKHKLVGYRGVIVGWDATCKAPKSWIKDNHEDNTVRTVIWVFQIAIIGEHELI